jgi:DUF4097 and DUF4098 domain-containing protein YvlB
MRIVLCSILGLFASSALANECRFHAERNLDIDPAGAHALVVKLGSSDAQVHGVAGLSKIEVRGRACASEESKLAGLTVGQSREGDRVVVTPNQVEERTFSLLGSNYAYIDLDVRIPASLALEIKSASGDATIADVASLDFSSHSGDLIAHHVTGDVAVEVHSGDIKADDIGNLEVRSAGSGDVRAHQVRGEIKVGHVGSGDLQFDDVSKGIHVESVGSGDVTVNHAGGNVLVDSIGSGDITVDSVGGDFVVKAAGSSGIHHHDVKGKIQVPNRRDD